MTTQEDIQYLRKVYPNKGGWLPSLDSLDFFYVPNVPKRLNSQKMYNEATQKVPDLYDLMHPVWTPDFTLFRNRYPSTKWWDNKTVSGFSDCQNIEIMHTPDDNPYYTVFGTWFYYAKGSGVAINIGKTLRAKNKLHALRLLGLSTQEIAMKFKDVTFMIRTDIPSSDLKSLSSQTGLSSSKIVEIAMFPERYSDHKDLYLIDRLNNSADFDETLFFLSRTQGYDTIQFTTQANGNGGWGFEILICAEKGYLQTDKERMKGVILLEYNPETPEASSPCSMNTSNYKCTYCSSQGIDVCKHDGKDPIVPPYASSRTSSFARSRAFAGASAIEGTRSISGSNVLPLLCVCILILILYIGLLVRNKME